MMPRPVSYGTRAYIRGSRLAVAQNHKLPQLSINLMRDAVERTEKAADLGGWYQGYWRSPAEEDARCRTALCIAGHAIELAGVSWYIPDSEVTHETSEDLIDLVLITQTDADAIDNEIGSSPVKLPDRGNDLLPMSAALYAEWLLGLTYAEARLLFAASNTLNRLREYVAFLTSPRYYVLRPALAHEYGLIMSALRAARRDMVCAEAGCADRG